MYGKSDIYWVRTGIFYLIYEILQWKHIIKKKYDEAITKTYLYNFDPIKPHFYIVKLRFTGVYIIFLFLLKDIDCGYSLESHHQGCYNEYPQSMFWTEM